MSDASKSLSDDTFLKMGCDIEDKSKIGQICRQPSKNQIVLADRGCVSLKVEIGSSLNVEKDAR